MNSFTDSDEMTERTVCRYDVMKLCWDHQPYNRPDFSELEAFFGTMLENSVKEVGLLFHC